VGKYWVDANVFIWGHREPYPLPGMQLYWNWFESQVAAGRITTHWKSFDEVIAGNKQGAEELIVSWAKSRKAKLVASNDNEESQALVGQICLYACETFGFRQANEFAKGADVLLIARAKLDSGTVVTQESIKKPVRIPAVCKAFGVPNMSLYQMNAALDIKL
jgi:hypothetical protein